MPAFVRALVFNAPLCWGAFVFWAATISYFSSKSSSDISLLSFATHADKVLHFIAFFIGSILLGRALKLSTPLAWTALRMLVFLLIVGFGAIDEWHQLYTPGRSGADLGDLMADAIGAALAAWMLPFIHERLRF